MKLYKITGLRGETIDVVPFNRFYSNLYGCVQFGWELFEFEVMS